MRFAAISDIHGNVEALEGVLADIGTRKVDLVVNLGDVFSGPLFPVETAERLIPLALPTIAGNHERQLLKLAPERMGPSDRFAASCLKRAHCEWMAALPATLGFLDHVLLVHGTPASDLEYFVETVDESGCHPATREEVRTRMGSGSAKLFLCGHTHLQRAIRLDDGRMAVNPGSVGLQAYEDAEPLPHKVQSGSPHARYATFEKQDGHWSVEMIQVAYDWEKMAAVAEMRGRPDWSRALRSGTI